MTGVRVGTKMKNVMTMERIRAMARPSNSSLTIATETIRGAAAPNP